MTRQDHFQDHFNAKVVWITGASSGIGEALACLLGGMGARLILSSNEADELERVRERCGRGDDGVMTLYLDLSQPDAMASKAEAVLERFGRVDFLFNNGGISQRSLTMETGLDVDRKIMEIDYFGQIALTKAVLPSMLERRSGHIVVTSSIAGVVGVPLRSAYCAAKHALHGFFDTLRAEVWEHNIRVTIICPAAVLTRISSEALTGDGRAFGKMDNVISGGIEVDLCADKMIAAVVRGKEEVVVGKGLGRQGVLVKRLFPGVYSRVVRRVRGV